MDPCTCNTCGPLGDPAWHLPLGPHDCGSAQGPAGPLGCHLPPKREVPACSGTQVIRPGPVWWRKSFTLSKCLLFRLLGVLMLRYMKMQMLLFL